MAKPLSVASTDGAGSSKSHRCNAQSPLEPSHRPRHRKPKSSLSTVGPSSGLLSLLATIASATTVYGSPAPPPFLCPSIESADVVDLPLKTRASTSNVDPYSDPASGSPNIRIARNVPDKFERGADGVWRRVESYTLYGATVPAIGDSRQPTNAVNVDDQIQVPPGNVNTNNTVTTPSYDIRDELPPGWRPTARPYEGRTTLILALSLVLAFFICFFIIGCLFWRNNFKKKHKYSDVEAKARRKRHGTSEEEVRELVAEKEIKTKQKIWARATARWKANVRYSARQRRGKRLSTRLSQAHQSSLSLDNSRSRLGGTVSSPHSRTSSRRSSTVSIPDQLRNDEAPEVTASTSHDHISAPESPQIATPASPPAYQHRGQIPPIVVSPEETSTNGQSGLSTPARFDRSRRPSHSSMYAPPVVTNNPQKAEMSPPTPIHAAHVATDDKTLLARLADFASAPEEDSSADDASTSEPQVSAPAWQDEELEDFAPDTHNDCCVSDASACSPSSLFPPPPPNQRLAAAELFEYSFAFEDMDALDPEPEPSAPPFEEGSSPPMDEPMLLPSAPPLLDDAHESLSSSHPSAPEWDSPSPQLDPREENTLEQDHDRIPSTDLTEPGDPTSSISQASTSGKITSSDNIVLPGYQP